MLLTNQDVFLSLVRAGLWEKDVRLSSFGEIDFREVYRLAEEQSVIGLVAAGIEHILDIKVRKEDVILFIGEALQLEQRNLAMNCFIGVIVDKMREEGIYTTLVKGQGVAQCYERPLWRACGDVDFLLSEDNYNKAKSFLIPLADTVEKESGKHQGMTIDSWVVELHGYLRCGLSDQMDKVIEDAQKDVFYGGNVRSWMNDKTQVFLPGVNNDIIFIFTHFLKHFYKGGLGLRQICDWSRLLWTYRDMIDLPLLEKRLLSMGLLTEWKAFGTFAHNYLGLPIEAIPLYDDSKKWERKARKILRFIMMSGNFGQNRDSSYKKYPFIIKKFFSMCQRVGDLLRHAFIFPIDSIRFFPKIMINGIKSAANGIG